MSFTVEELNPKKPVLKLGNKNIVLSLITLHKEVFFKEQYGSLAKAYEVMREDGIEILNIIWELVEDKNEHENNFEVFKKIVLTSSDGAVEHGKNMLKCLNEAVAKSQPLIKNQKRYKELQDIKGAMTDKTPCYGVYYDGLAKRYGYTLDQFYGLTLGQIHIMLNVIGDESYKELEVQAALQGRELKPRMEIQDISIEEEQAQEADAMDALKRLQEEYKKNQKDN